MTDVPSDTSTALTRWAPVVAGSAMMAAGILYLRWLHPAHGFDDAYITYRYAQHLAEGHGLVFNPGEYVEGYSTLLYALLMGLGYAIVGHANLYTWSLSINLLCACATAALAIDAVVRRGGVKAGWFAALTLAIFPSVWIAAWSGLETIVTVFLFTAIWRIAIWNRQDRIESRWLAVSTALIILLVISRADAFVMAAGIGAYVFVFREVRAGFVLCAATVVTFGAQVVFRLWYYGYPLPNTYYAKVSGDLDQRIAYAVQLFSTLDHIHLYAALVVLSGLVGALIVVLNRRSPFRIARFEILFAIAWFCYWVYVGGDIFGDRMFIVLLPMLTAFLWTTAIPPHRSWWLRAAVACVLVYQSWGMMPRPVFRSNEDSHLAAGRHLGELYPGAVMAVDAAGKLPYASRLTTIDSMGLCDEHIAHAPPAVDFVPGHNKTDMAYVLGREPDIIVGKLIPGQAELAIGPTREAYEPQYRLARLMRLGLRNNHLPITVDATGFTKEDFRSYQIDGYGYGVLERVE